MVLLPEEAEMTLAELRQMAARQQHQIEAQQQLLVAKEQRLKFLKQQEARHHTLAEQQIDGSCLQSLKEKVEAQELKLRHLRALRVQVEQQKTNNGNLGAELESIRALFTEKEKELTHAVNKVEELTRQLDDIRNGKSIRNSRIPSMTAELENLKRELTYRTQLTEQQNNYISQQRELIIQKQHDISNLDEKIEQLTQRLHRKRLMNQQLANQIHNVSLSRHSASSIINTNTYSVNNIATVEPIQRELQEPEHTQDDLSAKLQLLRGDLSEFSPKKNDPKYQTLPYNTKFTLKGKHNSDDLEQAGDDENSSCSSDSSSRTQQTTTTVSKQNHNMCNFAPRPFGSIYNSSNHVPVPKIVPQQSLPQSRFSEGVLLKPVAPVKVSVSENDINYNNTVGKDLIESKSRSTLISEVSLADTANQTVKLENPSDAFPIQSTLENKALNKSCSGINNIAKPAVPPKPAFPIKPAPPPRQTSYSKEQNFEQKSDIISMALSVLQNKSSEKEKSAFSNYKERLLYYRCVPRYSVQNNVNEHCSTDSKIATYFPKPASSDSKLSENGNLSEIIKRKPSPVHLPIKPKPLTIRKTPGLEPPKLKVQQTAGHLGMYRKSHEPNILSAHLKPIVIPSVSTSVVQNELVQYPVETNNNSSIESMNEPVNSTVDDKELGCVSISIDDMEKSQEKGMLSVWNAEQAVELMTVQNENSDNSESSESPTDSLEYNENNESLKTVETEVTTDDTDSLESRSAAVRRIKKGNLKTEGSARNPRRVSFDPLALLLDAALEGELDLVKKTATEVPNPSAANDEGITALHNAICAGHFEVVTFLVEFGCDVNAQDSDGWTPLHCAASCNNLPMVKFLVERGACIFATTLSDHETAAEKCEEDEEGFDGCSEYLYGLQENLGIINEGVVYAVYDYDGQNTDELSFKDGDKLIVLRNGDDQENEWWWSRLADQEGYVPRNLLGLYPRIPSKKSVE